MTENRRERPDNHVSVFPYPGGKGREADWILEKIPPHDTFVDVFGGSGAIIYNKPPSKNEVYNDANDDLVQFFDVLRNRTDELEEWVRNVPYARSVYDEWVHAFFNGYRPDDPIERAGRFWVLRYMQFAGDMSMPNGFKVRAKRSPSRTFDNARERLQELADRFSDVTIENRDWSRILDTYDDTDVDVVFYCDPPYLNKEHSYRVDDFRHADLADALAEIEGYALVSYTDRPDGMYGDWHETTRGHYHKSGTEKDEAEEKVTERLLTNFDPSTTPTFVDGEQQTLAAATDGGVQ